jgi:hypothetical protein
MKRSIIIIFTFCLIFILGESDTYCQNLWKLKRYEATAGFGPSFFFGDIGGFSKTENILGFKDMSFKQTRFNFNGSFKYRITSDINVRLSMTYGLLHATDKRGSNEGRGFEASVSILEPALIGEYYFIKNMSEASWLVNKGRGNRFKSIISKLDFYAFTGFGGLNYSIKPNEKLDAKVIEKKGLSAVVPVGVGSSFNFTPDLNLGVELGGRYTFTDNLDGYTSQYSSSNDVYYFLNFTITYKLKTGSNGLPIFR